MVSTVTPLESVTAVTATPALPAVSLKLIENPTAPSVSSVSTVYVAVYVLPSPGFATTSSLVAACAGEPDVNVTVGVPIASLEVKVRVTVLSALASVPSELPFDAIETEVNVGAVVSSTITVLVTSCASLLEASVTLYVTVYVPETDVSTGLNVTILAVILP